MSENLDHETGGTFATDDVYTEQCMNTKTIIIQSAEPSTKYDGQHWIDTDDDPPHVQGYDETNTQWMTYFPQYYISGAEGYKPPTDTSNGGYITADGTLSVQYDSTNTVTRLYFRGNSEWYGIEES